MPKNYQFKKRFIGLKSSIIYYQQTLTMRNTIMTMVKRPLNQFCRLENQNFHLFSNATTTTTILSRYNHHQINHQRNNNNKQFDYSNIVLMKENRQTILSTKSSDSPPTTNDSNDDPTKPTLEQLTLLSHRLADHVCFFELI